MAGLLFAGTKIIMALEISLLVHLRSIPHRRPVAVRTSGHICSATAAAAAATRERQSLGFTSYTPMASSYFLSTQFETRRLQGESPLFRSLFNNHPPPHNSTHIAAMPRDPCHLDASDPASNPRLLLPHSPSDHHLDKNHFRN